MRPAVPIRLPGSTRDVDAGFLDAALGHDTRSRLEIHDVVEGTTGRVRATLHREDGIDMDVFVKVPSRRRRARLLAELPSLTAAEVRFYRELSPTVSGVPRHHFAAHRRGRFAVVLEDLTRRADVAGGGRTCSIAEAETVLDLLAGLHGGFWEDARLAEGGRLGWLRSLRRRETRLGDLLAVPLTEAGIRRAAGLLDAAMRSEARRHARRRRRRMTALSSGPTTVVHADCHPGNLAFTTEDGVPRPVLCDWQLVRVGSWARDVAYFCATALEPADRRAHEPALLARYREALVVAGGPRLDDATVDMLHRAHTVVAFEAMLVTSGVGGLMPDDVAATLLARTVAAVVDHDGFGAVAALERHAPRWATHR